MPKPELLGLVLAGGESSRMGSDKGRLVYTRLSPFEQRLERLRNLTDCGLISYLSAQPTQKPPAEFNLITDHKTLQGGPGAGILSAHCWCPKAAWLVLACDFPFADRTAVAELISQRKAQGISTAYKNADGTIEPLFAIWEPQTLASFLALFHQGQKSPRHALEQAGTFKITPKNPQILVNVNSKEEAKNFHLS